MKKIFFVILSIALFAACKKDSTGSGEILLSKIIVDGKVEVEYFYNSAGQVVEEKNYDDNNGTYGLEYVWKFTYDANGNPKEVIYYKHPGNKPSGKYVYTLDAQGRILRNAIYDISSGDPGEFSTYIDLDYNPKGFVVKQIWKDENEVMNTFRELNYYPNGNMRTSESFWNYGLAPEKKWGSSFGPSDTTLPASFKMKCYPVNFYYNELVSPYINHYIYDNGVVDGHYKEVMESRQFNAQGLVTQQTITTKHIIPAGADESRVVQYEYRER